MTIISFDHLTTTDYAVGGLGIIVTIGIVVMLISLLRR